VAAVSTRDQRGPGRGEPGRGEKNVDAASRALGLSTGWNVFSYLIAGMAAYGLIGWLIGRAVHISLLFPIGMVVGLAISVGYVIYRYGRAEQLTKTERGDDR
jgi:F0F1-type ATP synthase assembly protein I